MVGCQRGSQWELTPVEGVVVGAAGPWIGVQVIFWPEAGAKAPRASGVANESGRYELITDAGGRGAAPGKYRVCILEPYNERAAEEKTRQLHFASRRAKARKDAPASSQLKEKQDSGTDSITLPKEYSQFDKTPLRAEIKPGGAQTIDFNIP